MIAATELTTVLALVAGIVGAVLAVIDLVRSHGGALTTWAALAASVGVIFLSIKVLD